MKKLFLSLPNNSQKFIYKISNSPEGIDKTDTQNQKPKDNKAVAGAGLANIGDISRGLPTLSPQAAKAVGTELPRCLAKSSNPADLAHLSKCAKKSKESITAQIEKNKNESQNPESGQEESEYSPEAIKEALSYFEAIEKIMAEKVAEIKKKSEEDPTNSELKDTLAALESTHKQIQALSREAQADIANMGKYENEGGAVGTLAQKVAQVAKGELGQANNDAEGNAKYTPGGVDQPWCMDFVNYCIEQAGGKGTGSSMANSVRGTSGSGHVGIVTSNSGETVEGNIGNSVNIGSIGKFEQAISPEDLATGNTSNLKDASAAREGDIVVKNRGNSRADTNEA